MCLALHSYFKNILFEIIFHSGKYKNEIAPLLPCTTMINTNTTPTKTSILHDFLVQVVIVCLSNI